ncbi:RcnB family protein [Qipengyuania sp.]|uniref:RcnB family protein n=1 Tax=Qipengyuania sp. TaxID=2004515 RepID=UPI0035C87D21
MKSTALCTLVFALVAPAIPAAAAPPDREWTSARTAQRDGDGERGWRGGAHREDRAPREARQPRVPNRRDIPTRPIAAPERIERGDLRTPQRNQTYTAPRDRSYGANERRGDRTEGRRDGRQDAREWRQDNRQDRREWRQDNREDRRDWRQDNREDRRDWRGDNRGDQRDWRQDSRGERRDDARNYARGYRDARRDDNRYGRDHRRWDNSWRRDNRYNWHNYRSANQSIYRLGRYYSPYRGYSYNRLRIGIVLNSLFYSNRYWINDPWRYRLPPAYGPYRWVRYYDDAMLVDTYSGEVVDVIYDFFW